MSSPVPPYIKYHDASRRCTRCGMVVLPQAAYCSTCGTAQSLAYTPMQVYGQVFVLWLAVICVIYAISVLWRFVLPANWAYALQCAVSGDGGDLKWPAGVPVAWFWADACMGPQLLLRQSATLPAFIAVPLADFYEYVLLDGAVRMLQWVVVGEQEVAQWLQTIWASLQSWWCTVAAWRWFCA